MISQPLVSVLLPVYNCEKRILEAIESVLCQTYQNFELIIIDDHSTDGTSEILKNISDNRVRIYTNHKNLKLAATLNKGMSICEGKYVARMDADDISCSNRLEVQVAFLEENRDYLLVGSAYIMEVKSENRGIRKQVRSYRKLKSKLLFGNNICHPSVMFNKELWLSNNLYYDENYVYAQDFELWTRAIPICKMANLSEALIIYRRDSDNSNSEKSRITNSNFERASINYIQSIFRDVLYEEAKQLAIFYRRPNNMSFKIAFRMYLKSIRICFQPHEFDYIDFILRIHNQLLKNIFK